jgi:hypothetical protein
MRKLLQYLAALLVAYILLMVLARLFENHLIFFPNFPGRLTGDWHPAGLPVEDVWLRASDGVKLHAWWIAPPAAEYTFVCFHGNAANIANRADMYRFLSELPVNVLAVDYRGYGRSEGAPSERGIYLDAEAAYEHLVRERGIPPRKIVAFGASLGSAAAVDLAAKHEVGGLVLEAPFASAKAVARRVYFFLPGLAAVMRAKFDTAAKLKNIHVPLLVVHCSRDPVLAFPLGEEVFRLANEPKMFLRIEGYCHEEASLVDPAGYRAALLAFLQRLHSVHPQ